MKSAELRIGNYVSQGRYGITPCSSLEISRFESSQNGNLEADYYKEWKPVDIDLQFLISLGFTKYDWFHGAFIKCVHKHLMVRFWKGEVLVYLTNVTSDSAGHKTNGKWDIIKYNRIQHIHQLQNLYFALTGEELQIKN